MRLVEYSRLTVEAALIALRAWNHWSYVYSMGYRPACRQLGEGFRTARASLTKASRSVVRRLIERYHMFGNMWLCLGCGSEFEMGWGNEGDHVIPLSWVEGVRYRAPFLGFDNFIPLCRKCNIAKRDRDLIRWWVEDGRDIWRLDRDALCLNLRLLYRYASVRNELSAEVGSSRYSYLLRALLQAELKLPDECHPIWCSRIEYLMKRT